MKKNLENYVTPWTKKPFPKTIQDEALKVLESLNSKTPDANTDAYTIPLSFGTGGVRGKLGNGVGRINEYTMARVALGFFRYIKSKKKDSLVIIAYDSRKKSKVFAKIVALIASSLELRVKIFRKPAPTPMLSYAIRYYKADGGAVITASHNPENYNGFKAYLSYGGQVISPIDKEITDYIEKITDWKDVLWDKKSDPVYHPNVDYVLEDCFESYRSDIEESFLFSPKIGKRERKKIKVVYTALHGAGSWYVKNLLIYFGYKNYFPVPEQTKMNGRFTTIQSPNPEDREALKMAYNLAVQEEADIFIGTDPDADRVGIGILDNQGEYQYLNGNQIGSIMAAYLCEKLDDKDKKENYFLLKTIVTTDLQENIAKKHGIECKSLLTGFKYIAEYMEKNEQEGKSKFLFGGEESYGYLPVSWLRDKDALTSIILILEILTEKKMIEKKDLIQYLDEIFLKYGIFQESLYSVELEGSEGQKKIEKIMKSLRKKNFVGTKIHEREIIGTIDFQSREVSGEASKAVFKDFSTTENVFQILLENRGKITVRPSGTEPKIKLYFSLMNDDSQNLEDIKINKNNLIDELDFTQEIFLSMLKLKD